MTGPDGSTAPSDRNLLVRAVDYVYGFFRPYLPEKLTVANGVTIRHRPLLDFTDRDPHYEESLVAGMEMTIEEGDSVVIVGGGKGVSTVKAAQLAGESGTVTTFEASGSQVETIRETLTFNYTEAPVEVRHAIVGTMEEWSESTFGDADAPTSVSGGELPDSDVLVLDCEGAETDVLEALETAPEWIVVETHGFLGAPRDTISDLLDSKGYSVVESYEEDASEGLFVLVARRE